MNKKFVRESLTEAFNRGIEPSDAMKTSVKAEIEKDLLELGLKSGQYEIESDLLVRIVSYLPSHVEDGIRRIELKYMNPNAVEFAKQIDVDKPRTSDIKPNINEIVQKALDSGLSKDYLQKIAGKWADKATIGKIKLFLNKKFRDKETEKFDEEYNRYVFIGFTDKIPVKVGNKTYYKDGLGTESIIKVDKYDFSSIASLQGIHLRARTQYPDGKVYYIDIPKFMMDEDRYESIPRHLRDIFDKYKRRLM